MRSTVTRRFVSTLLGHGKIAEAELLQRFSTETSLTAAPSTTSTSTSSPGSQLNISQPSAHFQSVASEFFNNNKASSSSAPWLELVTAAGTTNAATSVSPDTHVFEAAGATAITAGQRFLLSIPAGCDQTDSTISVILSKQSNSSSSSNSSEQEKELELVAANLNLTSDVRVIAADGGAATIPSAGGLVQVELTKNIDVTPVSIKAQQAAAVTAEGGEAEKANGSLNAIRFATVGRVRHAAVCVGALSHIVQFEASYATQRPAFGSLLFRHQVQQQRLSDAASAVFAIESGAMYVEHSGLTASASSSSSPAALEAALLGIGATKVTQEAWSGMMRMVGQYGQHLAGAQPAVTSMSAVLKSAEADTPSIRLAHQIVTPQRSKTPIAAATGNPLLRKIGLGGGGSSTAMPAAAGVQLALSNEADQLQKDALTLASLLSGAEKKKGGSSSLQAANIASELFLDACSIYRASAAVSDKGDGDADAYEACLLAQGFSKQSSWRRQQGIRLLNNASTTGTAQREAAGITTTALSGTSAKDIKAIVRGVLEAKESGAAGGWSQPLVDFPVPKSS